MLPVLKTVQFCNYLQNDVDETFRNNDHLGWFRAIQQRNNFFVSILIDFYS
jgi:hypothetical protein